MTLSDLHVVLTNHAGYGAVRVFSWDLHDWAGGEGVVEARLVLKAGLDLRLHPLVSQKKQVAQRFALLVGQEPKLLEFADGAWLLYAGKRAAWARRQLEP
jgi:hypothetical protein